MLYYIIIIISIISIIALIHIWYTSNYREYLLPPNPAILVIQITGIVFVIELVIMMIVSVGTDNTTILRESLTDAILLSIISSPLIYLWIIKPQINRQKKNIHIIADNVIDGIIAIDANGIINYANPATEKIFGYSMEELMGKSINMLMPMPYDRGHNQYIKKYLKTGIKNIIGIGRETVGQRKDGSIFPISLAISEIKSDNKSIFVGVIQDITERKEAEKKVEEARDAAIEASKAKSNFLANMSHEIRTPMNTIIGISDVLSENSKDEEHREYLEILKRSGDHLLSLINDVLDISKIEAGHMKLEKDYFHLSKLIKKVYDMLCIKAHEKGLHLSYSVSPNVPDYLVGDSSKLKQILINLIGNAIKFTQAGEIKIRVKKINHGDTFSSSYHYGNRYNDAPQYNNDIDILFEIEDTGIGIPQDSLKTIFHNFVQVDNSSTRKYGGTGLGLAISKKLVELMGGNIWAESEINVGSKFYFTTKFIMMQKEITPHRHTQTTKTKIENHKSKAKYNRHILLVDDSEDNRKLIELYLKGLPYNVESAENGLVAIEKYKNSSFDMILMDIQMPQLDGYIATQKIRKWEEDNNLAATPIVIVSANAFDEARQKSMESGATSYLTKPIKKTILLNAIEKYTTQNNTAGIKNRS